MTGVLNSILPFFLMIAAAGLQCVYGMVGQEVGNGDHKKAKEITNYIILEIIVVTSVLCCLATYFRI